MVGASGRLTVPGGKPLRSGGKHGEHRTTAW
jgi:hypothetical protein